MDQRQPTPYSPASPTAPAAAPAADDDELDVPPAPVKGTANKAAKGTNWINVALAAALVVAIGGVSFAAGRLTAPAAEARTFGNGTRNFPGGYFPGGGAGGTGGFRAGGGASIQGTVTAMSGTTLTLQLASGQTIQVSLDGTTTYHSQATATQSQVVTGATVLVRVNGFRPGGQPDASPGTGTTGAGLTATDVTIVP